MVKNVYSLQVLHFPETEGYKIHVTHEVANVRPYIVCCIVRNIDLEQSSNMFKRFITLQVNYNF